MFLYINIELVNKQPMPYFELQQKRKISLCLQKVKDTIIWQVNFSHNYLIWLLYFKYK